MFALLLAVPAYACGPSQSASANPSSATAGDSVNIFGNAFLADTVVEARFGGAGGTLLAQTTTTAEGSFAVRVEIPADATVGSHSVWVGQPVEGGRSTAFNFAVVAPVETEPETPPIDETPVDETPVDETPVDETPVDETPVDETPVDETPVDETPVDETPVDETPVDETPVDETPVDETPVDETPVDETPVDETPVDETPVDETPVDETPVDEPVTPTDPIVNETPAIFGGQTPAEPGPSQPVAGLVPAPAPAATTTGPQPATSAPTAAAPSQPAPARELVGAATQADAPNGAERALLAGAGITSSEEFAPGAEPLVVEATPSTGDLAEANPDDAGGGITPWALVPLMLLAAGLLAASGAALTTEVRQRVKAKVKA